MIQLKHCPGFEPAAPSAVALPDYRQAPHDLPADTEHFNSNKGGKDGLSARCRQCGNAYGKAWAAAKKAGVKFALRAPTQAEPAADQAPEPEAMPTRTYDIIEGGQLVPVAAAEPDYFDDLARRAAAGEAEGYSAEVIDGVTYALPTNGTASTPEGQAALEATNAAHAAARRKRDRDRKREQRAAAKAPAQA